MTFAPSPAAFLTRYSALKMLSSILQPIAICTAATFTFLILILLI